jgi:serine/threonine-protein kinase
MKHTVEGVPPCTPWSNHMALMPGSRVGPYEILSAVGAGGMGEVYRARDTRLKRDVAMKVLPDVVAQDPDRLARFRREAQLLASLNHPNIAAIYGLDEGALVLELVDGPTLADLTLAGPLPVPEALGIARQICSALEAAHDQGIVHRDLKPSNVKVRPDGSVKVLDFGLAKALIPDDAARVRGDAAVADAGSRAATVTSPAMLTGVGMLLGTAAYMSPEQARGLEVDRRSDIWAFGCVLYEMLTGRRAFGGDDVTDTLSRVLQREPDFAALSPDTPAAVQRLLTHCLQKDRNRRLSQIAVAAFQIEEALSTAVPGTPSAARQLPATVPGAARRLAAVAGVAGAIAGAGALWLVTSREAAVSAPVTRLQMSLAPADEIGGIDGRPTRQAFVLSPDGRTLVFSAVQKNQRSLFVRRLDQAAATTLAGTENAIQPFFSPDGQWVGYLAEGEIRKVPLGGGPPVVIASEAVVFGASWGDDDRIVFAGALGGLREVPAGGGTVSELTAPDRVRLEVSHRLPHVLPDADAVLYTVTRNRFPRWDQTQVWLYSRSTRTSRMLIDGGADARYVATGHLVFAREGVLLAVPFDLRRLEVTGSPVGVLAGVMQAAYAAGQGNDTGAMQASISATGTLAYIGGGVSVPEEFAVVQVDREGRATALPIPPQPFRTVRRSPRGDRLALSTIGKDRAIWIYDVARQSFSKLAAADRAGVPIWTPDGERVTYVAGANGPDSLGWLRADGGGSPETLVTSERNLVPATWTPDGRHLLYYVIPGRPTMFVHDRMNPDGAPLPVAAPLSRAGGADVSPDGRWVAYHSVESGQNEVYVDAYPGPGPRFQVSTGLSGAPVWRGDGRELFYIRSTRSDQPLAAGSSDVAVMAVTVTTSPTLAFSAPRELFAGRYSVNAPARGYDVTADGQNFLLLAPRPRPADVITSINVVQNWTTELTAPSSR